MSVRRFVFTPSEYDPDYYESEFPSPEYDDQDRWAYYVEDCITDVDRAREVAEELYWTVTDDDTGQMPAFMKVDVEYTEFYTYGTSVRGGVEVTVETMDDPREIKSAWAERQGDYEWNTARDSTPRHRRQALSRFNREMAKAERMYDALVDAGFVEVADTGRVTAMEAWGNDPYRTTEVPSPYEWPSRSRKGSKGRRPAGKPKITGLKSVPSGSKAKSRGSKGRSVRKTKIPANKSRVRR